LERQADASPYMRHNLIIPLETILANLQRAAKLNFGSRGLRRNGLPEGGKKGERGGDNKRE